MNPPCQRIRKFKENIMENMCADVMVQYQMISLFQILYLWYQLGLRRNCCPHFLWKREDLGMLYREHVLLFSTVI